MIQSLPHLKDPLEALVFVKVRNLDLTSLSLRLSVRRKATRGLDLKTLAQRAEEDKILKCLRIIDDIERRAGLYVITSGTATLFRISQCGNNGKLALQHGGFSTMTVDLAKFAQ